MHQEKFDFFPLNRALSLSAMDEDSTESKVDDLLRQVNLLVERQREEVTHTHTHTHTHILSHYHMTNIVPPLYDRGHKVLHIVCLSAGLSRFFSPVR